MRMHFRREQRGDEDEALCGMKQGKHDAEPTWTTSHKPDVTCWRCIMLVLGRPLPTEPDTPEHRKLEAEKHSGRDATQMLGEFLSEFLREEGVRLARYDDNDELYEINETRQLMAKFFGINENALEAEKQALLDYQRKLNAAIEWATKDGRDALQRS